MKIVAMVLVGLVAVAHVWFLVLEMFIWNRPLGHKIFKQTPEDAEKTAVLAKNQGLYNGFLAAGLVWGLLISEPTHALHVQTFFLVCVVVAGIYGAITASRNILFLQALPAAAALGAVWAAASAG